MELRLDESVSATPDRKMDGLSRATDPGGAGTGAAVVLDELVGKARAVNRRLLDAERVGQGCVLASPAFERIARPSLVDVRKAPAVRFGDPRVMALAGAWP